MKTVHKKPKTKPVDKAVATPALPSREAVAAFLAEAKDKVGLREIARAFGVGPDHKKGLRMLVRSLETDGVLERAGPQAVSGCGQPAGKCDGADYRH